MIGSDAKSVRLKQDIAEAGLAAEYASKFYCPMGLDLGTNHPQEIAVSIVAQLLSVRDQVRADTRQRVRDQSRAEKSAVK